MKKIILMKLVLYIIIILVVVLGGLYLYKNTNISMKKNTHIENTSEEITRIKNIKQWEFLAVTTEEMVDTTRKRMVVSDDLLCNIYSGTLRIGVNLDKADDDWVSVKDTVVNVKLPAIGLLDNNFIDEAGTKVFLESGRWDGSAMNALYKKAEQKMKQRALTKENIAKAETNGVETFTRLFESLGFKKVNVSFGK